MNTHPKHALIGGITGGIGSAIARKLAREGWQVSGFSQTKEKLESLKKDIPNGCFEVLDATSPEPLAEFMESISSSKGPFSAYVHAIGSFLIKPVHLVKQEEWQALLAVNLNSAFFALQALIPHMLKQKNGSVLFFSSVASKCGLASHEGIAAVKSAINGLVLSAAASHARHNIRFNAIAPSLTETPGTQFITNNPSSRQISEKLHPLGRLGKPDYIASLAAYLLSPNGSWVTGQIFSIDGGLSTLKSYN